jgi:hypothetical protein
MLGSEILDYFSRHPVLHKHLAGVFAADQLRNLRLCNRSAAVVNTDKLVGEGKLNVHDDHSKTRPFIQLP